LVATRRKRHKRTRSRARVSAAATAAANRERAFTNGIDVSRHQGSIDWAEVAASGIRYCYVKATEGATLRDVRFDENWRGAAANGIARGAYHFFSPAIAVDAQFANFIATVTAAASDLPPALDLEVDGQNWAALAPDQRVPAALELLRLLEAHYGVRPLVYTNKRTVDEVFGGTPGGLVEYPLWIASYKKNPPPTLPTGWSEWKHWQHSQTGTVGGVKGPVDLNRCTGDPAAAASPRAGRITRRATGTATAPPGSPPALDPISAFDRVWRNIREESAGLFPEGIAEASVRLKFERSGEASIEISVRGRDPEPGRHPPRLRRGRRS
jgi:lysozyme